jgi:predicted short-subunit dehydrogenase-like oxidoreductase (DUF2520 family)
MAEFNRQSRIAFLGAGKVGGSLALALSNAGYPVIAVASRTPASSDVFAARIPDCVAYDSYQEAADAADVTFITTSDGFISTVAASVTWRPGQAVVHCSGAASLDLFDNPVSQGAVPGAFHPLQAFSSVENGVKSIPGTTFGIEAGDDIKPYFEQMAHDIGAIPVFLRAEDKVMYHLSGVLMGNLLTCLVGIAGGVWEHIGSTRADGIKALLPMMRAVANNIEVSGIPDAVAGPYPRGDVGTVRKHLEALKYRDPGLMPMYCELALAGLPQAVERGLNKETSNEIQKIIESYKDR